VVAFCKKSTIERFVVPSFQDGSGSEDCAEAKPPSSMATTEVGA